MSPPYHIKANFYQKVIDVTSRGQKIDFRKKELVNSRKGIFLAKNKNESDKGAFIYDVRFLGR